jgi:hypothetical protein
VLRIWCDDTMLVSILTLIYPSILEQAYDRM